MNVITWFMAVSIAATANFTVPVFAADSGSDLHLFIKSNSLSWLANSPSPLAVLVNNRLEGDVKKFVETPGDYEMPAQGCDLGVYLTRFSYGPKAAAPALLSLAIYLSARKFARVATNSVLADKAQSLANKIINNWSSTGFTINSHPIVNAAEFCDPYHPGSIEWLVGLQVGRALVPWTQALMLFDSANIIPRTNTDVQFVQRLREIVEQSADIHAQQKLECGRYDNQSAMHILAIAASSIYLGDQKSLSGLIGFGTPPIRMTWQDQISGAIYGISDKVRGCYQSADPAFYFQTDTPALGEIVDRFRAGPGQALGYTIGSLTLMMLTADLLNNYTNESSVCCYYNYSNFTGPRGQNLESALAYYSIVTEGIISGQKNGFNWNQVPDFQQYQPAALKTDPLATAMNLNGLLNPCVIATSLFPENGSCKHLLDVAKKIVSNDAMSGTELILLSYLIDTLQLKQ